jgi:hypothetical protein
VGEEVKMGMQKKKKKKKKKKNTRKKESQQCETTKSQGGNEVYGRNEGRGSFGGRVAAKLAFG